MMQQSVQNSREDYIATFHTFAQAVERLISLQECEEADSFAVRRAEGQVREAQNAYREARERLASLLLERRGLKSARLTKSRATAVCL